MADFSRNWLGILAACVCATACSVQFRPRGTSFEITDYKLESRSNTSWTVVVDDSHAVDGEFNETLDLPDEAQPVCAVVTKKLVDGFIRARVNPDGAWIETDSPNGSIAPCCAR